MSFRPMWGVSRDKSIKHMTKYAGMVVQSYTSGYLEVLKL